MPWHKQWTEEAAQALLRPFPAEEIDLKEGLAYVDARTVQRRLDEVVGPGGWSFTWEPVEITAEHVAVMGSLSVLGVLKCDAGEAHAIKNSRVPEELVKFAVSDAIKRCAVQFGVGRFLYEMGKAQGGRLSDQQIARAATKTGFKQEAVVLKQAEVEFAHCANCGDPVDDKIAPISVAKFGEVLCVPCGRGEYGKERASIMAAIQNSKLPAGSVAG